MAQIYHAPHGAQPGKQLTVQKATNLAGAAISLALLVGVGVWGYKLLVRDVSGVPVVRAAEGPMRVQPDDPGGSTAQHQGLAVNDVAAVGAAARPADRLVLAPEPLTLSLEDAPSASMQVAETAPAELTPQAEASEPAPSQDDSAATLAALTQLADQLAEGASPLKPLKPQAPATAEAPLQPVPEVTAPQVAVPQEGLGRSLRPKARPARVASVEDAIALSVAAQAAPEVDPNAIPAGTRMAQLGAFESAQIADEQWGKLSDRFSEYLDGKQKVVQRAQSGGRVFYRLRAMGFADLNDARRFCSALVAEKADCIPVVTR